MKCLGCGGDSWSRTMVWCDAIVDERWPVSVKEELYQCNSCQTTSATPEMMERIQAAWLRQAEVLKKMRVFVASDEEVLRLRYAY